MNEQSFVTEQFSLSTAEEESIRINVESPTYQRRSSTHTLPDGVYRVIAGELFRLVPGIPHSTKR